MKIVLTFILHRHAIWSIAKNTVYSRYAGSVGGLFWAIAQPLVTTIIYYFVFTFGFRASSPDGTDTVLWLICGLVPWFFFAETIQLVSTSITSNAFLVKRVMFNIETLTFAAILSVVISHLIFLIIFFCLLVTYTTSIKIEALQFLYFLLCGCALLLGVGWFIASVNVFYRDVGHGVSVFVNLLFWLTPIVWYKEMIPEKFHFIAEYNPIHYVIEGYRSSFVLSEVILPTFQSTACFWSVTITFLIIGNLTFKRLQPEFPDVI